MSALNLSRDAFGQLLLTRPDGTVHTGVLPVRAFPIAAPGEGIALVDHDGREVAWIDHIEALGRTERELIEAALAGREFMPEIHRLAGVSTFATPSTWEVETDRGNTRFVLKGEEDIRRIGAHGLLIGDSHGIQYFIRDLGQLDKASRRLLDRFM